MPTAPRVPVTLNRRSPDVTLYPFMEYFQGFERVGAVRSVFREKTEKVLKRLRIGFIPNRAMYMGIRDGDGNIAVGTYHLKNSSTRVLYLDVIHELFHINQRMSDGKFFHDEFMKFLRDRSLYYASPIEIPAYEHTVREAERIGMSREEILEYLKIGEAPAKTWRKFVKAMNLSEQNTHERVRRFPVKVRRDVPPVVYRFSEYFRGFQKVASVRDILGEGAEKFLSELKVEFIDSPFPALYPSEDGGRLIVVNDYFRTGDVTSLYLDVFLCLNLLKRAPGALLLDPNEFGEDKDVVRAYASMVGDGRRLDVSDAEISARLGFNRFIMRPPVYKRFLKLIGLDQSLAG